MAMGLFRPSSWLKTLLQQVPCGGKTLRHFSIDPSSPAKAGFFLD
jgi:hypothetical protein